MKTNINDKQRQKLATHCPNEWKFAECLPGQNGLAWIEYAEAKLKQTALSLGIELNKASSDAQYKLSFSDQIELQVKTLALAMASYRQHVKMLGQKQADTVFGLKIDGIFAGLPNNLKATIANSYMAWLARYCA